MSETEQLGVFQHRRWRAWLVMALIGIAAAIKAWLIVGHHVPFNADEAIVALMARHINQGQTPLFFYGQSYMGSLDALLVAVGFRLLGQQVWVIRVIQSLLYLGTIWTTVVLGIIAFRSFRVGWGAGLLLAIPTVNMTLYTTASLGGYGETLLLGNLILILGFRIANSMEGDKGPISIKQLIPWVVWGALAGFGVWVFGLTLVYSLPMGGYLAWTLLTAQPRSKLHIFGGSVLLGGLFGGIPWLIYGTQHGWGTLLQELTGSAVANLSDVPVLLKPFVYLYRYILLGSTVTVGLRPPWSVKWLLLPLIPFVLMFWAGVGSYVIRRLLPQRENRAEVGVIAGVILANLAGFVFTPFGADPSGRYFLPMTVALFLFAAEMIFKLGEDRRWLSVGLLLLVLVYHLGGIFQSIRRRPQGLTTQFDEVARIDHAYDDKLVKFLRENDLTRGYTNYWVAYPLAFRSREELIYVPQLPYHHDFRYTSRDNRYPPYQKLVDEAESVTYITTNHPALDRYLKKSFRQRGVTWEYAEIGDYHIFFDLSKTIRPEDIGLGETTQGKPTGDS